MRTPSLLPTFYCELSLQLSKPHPFAPGCNLWEKRPTTCFCENSGQGFFFLSGGSHTTLFSNIIIFQSKDWRSPAGNSYHVAWLTETARRHLHLLLEISNPPTYATCSPHLLTRLPAWTGALRAFSAFGLTGKAAGKVRITSAYSRGETSRGACPSEQPPFRRAQDGRPRGKRRGESGPKTRPRPDAG